jgi:hypothetical protein
LILDRRRNADRREIVVGQTRQDGYGEDLRLAQFFRTANPANRRNSLLHHRMAAGSVHVEHRNAVTRGFDGRARNGLRNVVKFEI